MLCEVLFEPAIFINLKIRDKQGEVKHKENQVGPSV